MTPSMQVATGSSRGQERDMEEVKATGDRTSQAIVQSFLSPTTSEQMEEEEEGEGQVREEDKATSRWLSP